MTLLQSIFMGIIQGLTEFLPVSSSGHLAIFQSVFHIETNSGMLFELLLHLGTLAAICTIYWKDILHMIGEFFLMIGDFCGQIQDRIYNKKNPDKQKELRRVISNSYRKFDLLIIVTSIPTGIIGFAASDLVDQLSNILLVPGICLIITGILLLISDRVKDGSKRSREATFADAFIIGICQGIATLPGLSRSGTTITACLLCGFERKYAVKYSFIMSIPAILGGLLKEILDYGAVSTSSGQMVNYLIGTVVAGIVGYICIKTMLVLVQKKKFTWFAVYCFCAGTLAIAGYFITA